MDQEYQMQLQFAVSESLAQMQGGTNPPTANLPNMQQQPRGNNNNGGGAGMD